MNLDVIWEQFITLLNQEHKVNSVYKKIYTGIPFLYITAKSDLMDQQQLGDILFQAAAKAMKGKQLTCDITFVRMKSKTFVYRIRFKVPQEKLFCCGNGCTNCVRLKN